jgi:hypothetical protein
MSLPFDICRCNGVLGLGPDAPICPRRNQCERHLAIAKDSESCRGQVAWISVAQGLCMTGEDWLIAAESSE